MPCARAISGLAPTARMAVPFSVLKNQLSATNTAAPMIPAMMILAAGKPGVTKGAQSNTEPVPKIDRFDLPMMRRLML